MREMPHYIAGFDNCDLALFCDIRLWRTLRLFCQRRRRDTDKHPESRAGGNCHITIDSDRMTGRVHLAVAVATGQLSSSVTY